MRHSSAVALATALISLVVVAISPPAAADARDGRVAPAAAQKRLAAQPGLQARFNEFGTPRLLTPRTGALAEGLPADPEAAARAYLRADRDLFGLSEAALDDLELVAVNPIGDGAAVLLRQRFGDLAAGIDGLVAVAVRDGRALFASSSLTKDAGAPPAAVLTPGQAVLAAANDAGRTVSGVQREPRGRAGRWSRFGVPGFSAPANARAVAVPTPRDGVRAAYQVVLADDDGGRPLGVAAYVDARTGEVLVTEDLVDFLADNPTFDVFGNTPPLDYSSSDTRELWCWTETPGCVRAVASAASPRPWDVDVRTDTPTGRTEGNNARATERWVPVPGQPGTNYAEAPTRDFRFPWTNQWHEQGCNPDSFTSPGLNDVDAATSNLFAMLNRMHDWSYGLGFTETAWNPQDSNFGRGGAEADPAHGNAQANAIAGSRNNANQTTPADGLTPTTNMYLWQPIAGVDHVPCVDGDYDMTVIGHEYTHAISNRMVAGPDNRLAGAQANAMGESWSDLAAVEYLAEYGFAPGAGANPWAVGAYVTGNRQQGIRNYGMNVSPLNYSDVGYDVNGPQVHADGEIWSAVQFAIREGLNRRYDGRFPSSDLALQQRCADGVTPLTSCPGNRRWIQLVFDAWLLMADGAVSMVDARDAMLAADRVRFGGAHQALLWDAFAAGGVGEAAVSAGADDPDPRPSFASPTAASGAVVLAPRPDADSPVVAQLYIGHFEARATPVADTDPATADDERAELVPGRYDALIRADGFGTQRIELNVRAGRTLRLDHALERNFASRSRGAVASGDGESHEGLIDDTESTNWAAFGAPVAGRQVTVRLAGAGAVHVRRVQLSALLRPGTDAGDPGLGQSRFSALRSFDLLSCQARARVTCENDADYSVLYRSAGDAFPAVAPRPRAPQLIMRSFDVPNRKATHLRLVVRANQCTGAPAYAGEQDQDPRAATDCGASSAQAQKVRAAELQVFER